MLSSGGRETIGDPADAAVSVEHEPPTYGAGARNASKKNGNVSGVPDTEGYG
jgi:hypothetical protein